MAAKTTTNTFDIESTSLQKAALHLPIGRNYKDQVMEVLEGSKK